MPRRKSSARSKAAKKANGGSPKRRKFVQGLIDGKSMRRAALDAGYTPSMAKNASHRIMPAAREEFEAELERRIPEAKLVQRIAEGLDAVETRLAQYKGKFTSGQRLVAWESRRRYVELACKLKGYLVEWVQLSNSEEGPLAFDLKVNFVDPEEVRNKLMEGVTELQECPASKIGG